MKRRVIIALSIMGVVLVILALALASVGTELDQARIDRDDYQFQVDDLQQEVDGLTQERQKLQQRVDEQLKTIEQWKGQQEHARTNGQAAAGAPAADSTAPVGEPAPAAAP